MRKLGKDEQAMSETIKTYVVRFNNGFHYEYGGTVEARSVREARSIWKRRGDWKSDDFRVSEQKKVQGDSA